MLRLTDIRKSYRTADFTQVALDGVSIAFRDNEFVAILGPSGSGKTTLLNIVGGLDHYDSGDLAIDGVSTNEYRDRDWDTYRNNRVGFVFQSYNLIPHQTVAANVELALTLSGVSRAERRQRALDALAQVGLAEHAHKLPSQLSGGQMQRVAIARALINDPEILLADEPTGALDSKTSVQVMDLLTGIAKDRLVVMVTHNPDLAEQYANRVVHLADGQVTSDSRPFEPTVDDLRNAKEPRRSRMSFLTAIALSFSNLMTKKGRTLMTSFAGSIGIIGIASILALANGVNSYVQTVEEDTLSQYPLSIQSSGFDLGSLLDVDTTDPDNGATPAATPNADSVSERNIVARMFSSVAENDLGALKTYLDSGQSDMDDWVSHISYSYNVTPQIYLQSTAYDDQPVRVNPDQAFDTFGGSAALNANPMMGTSSMSVFSEMLDDPDVVQSQYQVVAGHWPKNYDEMVLVLDGGGGITDFLAYELGLRDHADLEKMVDAVTENESNDVEKTDESGATYTFDQILNVRYKLVNAFDLYSYDDNYDVWTDRSDDADFLRDAVAKGTDLHIVGIVKSDPNATAHSLTTGINYSSSLISHLMSVAADAPIVKEQLAQPDRDVFSGDTFAELKDGPKDSDMDMSKLISIDQDAIKNAFKFDQSKLNIDMSSAFKPSDIQKSLPAFPKLDFAKALSGVDLPSLLSKVKLDDATVTQLQQALAKAATNVYDEVSPDFPTKDVQSLAMTVLQGWYTQAMKSGGVDLTDTDAVLASFQAYLARPGVVQDFSDSLNKLLDESGFTDELQKATQKEVDKTLSSKLVARVGAQVQAQVLPPVQDALGAYLQDAMTSYMTKAMGAMGNQMGSSIKSAMSGLATELPKAFSIDEKAFVKAFKFNMDPDQLAALMQSMMSKQTPTLDTNLYQLGYADPTDPSQIDIYPRDFDAKQHVLDILDAYNNQMKAAGDDGKVVTYTDFVGVLMGSVTDIVNAISYVLVAFVSISLVVSSIMIGVITYISVLERKKEIGILRSIGASKRDIRRVFNAETLIVGFVAGLIGILVTLLLSIPVNIFVEAQYNVPNVANLPWLAAIVLVAVSMFLTFISGLIPSSAAAKADPVEALRSE